MRERYNEYKEMIEAFLAAFSDGRDKPYATLFESMRYSLLAGGKRIRPILTLEFCRMSGADPQSAVPIACAVEMLHTYSLIHDDLPCMDNDDLRRGKPTNHKVFGETTAVLAGDALQAEAFDLILSSNLPAERRCDCARHLSYAAGKDGICGGQFLDMLGEERSLTENELKMMCEKKTASMISAACMMGVVAAGGDKKQVEAARIFGEGIGLAFQIRDDILDVCGTDSQLGKSVGSDARDGKNTFMSIFGLEKCEELVSKYTECAKTAVADAFADTEFICALADDLTKRNN